MFSFKNTFANIIPNIEDVENNNIVFIIPILFRLWRKKNKEAPNPNEPANTKYGIWKMVTFKSWIPKIIINKIKRNNPPIKVFKAIISGMWIVLERILLILLSRAQKSVEPIIRILPILNSTKEFDENYIFVVRITMPTKTSIIATISRWINFSLKNTIAKRIENKTSPLISIEESDAEVFERP
jgi:hypothetical protein